MIAASVEEMIKAEAKRLGFYACGIARADEVEEAEYARIKEWLAMGMQGEMSYLERNENLRRDPRLLLPGTRSLIMVAMNYYPRVKQDNSQPQVAYYAYGRDYHKVLKKRLDSLLAFIQSEVDPTVVGRSFTDSAPILERYWAVKAGLGWRGKNGLLIIPGAGSYFFLGALLISTELQADSPQISRCGRCRRCLDVCPTKALLGEGLMDARKCISYLTIEQTGEIAPEIAERMGNRLYGCDACQQVCPWNRYAQPSEIEDFTPRPIIMSLKAELIELMNEEEFRLTFAGSAIKRAGLVGLQRSLRAIRSNLEKLS